ncbi:hypothetical protein ACH4F6_13045 [Streptomyces sp. NPDC017936]|uniref:hypothetical protein n=1 Tax=Streptomyces sp. NPDC017936 TaxID=3365016 RepID=UPI0037AE7785
MPEDLSISRLAAVTLLALVCAALLTGLRHVLRRGRRAAAVRRPAAGPGSYRTSQDVLPAVPGRRRIGPSLEAVDLTPAERDAFERLARRLDGGR